jgi:tripartite-type tricarboxylate transporter receptor subunit TctC
MAARRNVLTALSAMTAAMLSRSGWSQSPVVTTSANASIVSGFPPGGLGDFVARPVAERLRGRYASNVLVESRTGAGGRIAVEYVKRAAPDGMTILQIPSSPMVLYPNTYKKLSYDTLSDFIPVTSTVNYAFSITAGPGLPAEIKTLSDYLKWAKSNPRQANYGIPAAGSALHFVGMMLSRESGVELTSVAYRGGAPLLQDVLGGQVPISINVLGEVAPYIRSGKLRSLAVTSGQRSTFLPDIPTLAEQGFKDLIVQEWLGWFVPARTPAEIVQRLNGLVRESLQSPEMIESLARNSLQPMTQTVDEFARTVRADLSRWSPIVKSTGFTAED